MTGRPERGEAASFYWTYIDLIPGEDILGTLERQTEAMLELFEGISEEKSRYRYAPGKWSIRQVLNHINDCERVLLFRALWFARGGGGSLAGFDQDVFAQASGAEELPWAAHVEEFRAIRQATLAFFRHLPEEGWTRCGTIDQNPMTVRALAYIIAGHVANHESSLKKLYS
jgi:uncharacterized damage-inducible protein DinB